MSLVSFLPVSLCIFGICVFFRMIIEKKYAVKTIILNLILGGILYAVLNYWKVELPFNLLSGICITFLGIPGVFLFLIMKYLMDF